MILTPLETDVLNASALAAGLAATVMVQDLIRKDTEAQLGLFDRSLPAAVREEARKDMRDVNTTLSFIASVQAIAGISA